MQQVCSPSSRPSERRGAACEGHEVTGGTSQSEERRDEEDV